jgi:23S rRNA-/tRNA-specific pseudouridylate synthase
MRVSSNGEGEEAITHYEVLENTKRNTRVKFVLETGKKNQIRVQTSHQGHPIAGDKKYGKGASHLKRLALHAHKLEFTHPITNKRLSFTSPVPF